jgi:hypothetical protein
MGRRVACVLLLFGLGAVAEAGPMRKVVVETDPPGATVYLNDKEAGPVCAATPCTIEVPVNGEANLIIEESSYAPEFATVDTSKRTSKPISIKVSLKKAIGFITIESPKGATVSVDDKDSGTVPAHVEVEAGGHHVVVTANNKAVFDDFVNVDVNEDIPVTPAATTGGTPPPEGTPETDKPPAPETGKHRRPYVFGSAAFDIGFRKFTYDNAQPNHLGKQDLNTEDEAGQVLVGPLVEIYPTAIANIDALPGLALVVRYEYGVNSQSVMANNLSGGLSTYWSSLEIGAKYRWVVLEQLAIEASGGYLSDTYRYNGAPADVALVPDVQYQSLRIGGRAAFVAGQFEPYLVLESRLVVDGGNLGGRFPGGASTSGLHGALGVQAHFGALGLRIEGSLTQYSWTFKTDPTMDTYVADGGSDSIKQITLAVGYAY